MLVLTPKYGSQIDIDLLNKQKDKQQDTEIKHRQTIDLNQCKNIKEAYLAFLNNKDKYIIGYEPKNSIEIRVFVKSLGEIDTLDVSWIDVSKLDILNLCFLYCKTKHIVGLDKWDVSNIKDMYGLFNYCEKLESIDISGWDVSSVKDMSCMFLECKNLENIGDISSWEVSYVGSMGSMFFGCKNLTSIGDISGWNVKNVNDMLYMFKECKKLKSVGNLEQWNIDTLHVTVMYMFLNSAIKPIPSWYNE